MRAFVAAALLASALPLVAAQIPRQSPEYVINLPGGRQDLLSKYKGKVVVLEFLLTTCPHCQKSATVLSKLQKEYGPKVQVLGVAINPEGDVAGFQRQYATGFQVGWGTRETAMSYLQHSIMAPNFYVPQVVIVDKAGMIRGQWGGADPFVGEKQEENMKAFIDKLLAEGGPAAGKKAGTPSKAKAAAKKTTS
jgi:thiol-disulfide isomerase/thioredoxin